MTKEDGDIKFYIYAPRELVKDVETFIKVSCKGEWNYPLKESLYFDNALTKLINGVTERNVCGWVDIKNDYFFFTDKKMCDDICELFTQIRNIEEKEAGANK